ncbi:MAG: hypothetical protein E7163_02860 [Firmicutes bacterium]|nr:hypothetical protein [Bacillota bacterium]
MRKVFQYVSLFAIAAFLMFSFKIDALAEGCGSLNNNQCRITKNRVIKVVGNNNRYDTVTPREEATGNAKYMDNTPPRYSQVGISYKSPGYKELTGTPTFNVYDDGKSAMFCFDPQLEGTDPLYGGRFLLDTAENEKTQILDYALLSVLTDHGILTHARDEGDNQTEYFARLLAIRAIIFTFNEHSKTETFRGYYYATLSTVNEWLKDSNIEDKYNEINEILKKMKKNELKAITEFGVHLDYYFSGDILNKAKTYYSTALDKALEYAKSISNQPKIKKEVNAKNKVESNDATGKKITKDVVHTITVSGIPRKTNNTFKIKGLTLSGTYSGLTAKITNIKIGTANYNESQLNTILNKNLLENFDFTSETKIQITINFSGYETGDTDILKCGQQPIKYLIDGTYSYGNFNEYNKYVATIWYTGPDQQRYLSVEEAASYTDSLNIQTWESKYETNLIEACSCNQLMDECVESGSINSNQCKELEASNCGECSWLYTKCQINSSYCDAYYDTCESEIISKICPTEIDTLECCDEYGELIVWQENDDDTKTQTVNIKGPSEDDIAACFVDNLGVRQKISENNKEIYDQTGYKEAVGAVDEAENTYVDVKNKYCVISCKEDYVLNMPTAQRVNAGRYFTFKMDVNATKTCYTNEIDETQYDKDVEAILEDLSVAYTQFKKYQNAIEYLSDTSWLEGNDNYLYAYSQLDADTTCSADSGAGCSPSGYYYTGYNNVQVPYIEYDFQFSGNVFNILELEEKYYKITDDGLDDGGFSDSCPDEYCGECYWEYCNCAGEISSCGDTLAVSNMHNTYKTELLKYDKNKNYNIMLIECDDEGNCWGPGWEGEPDNWFGSEDENYGEPSDEPVEDWCADNPGACDGSDDVCEEYCDSGTTYYYSSYVESGQAGDYYNFYWELVSRRNTWEEQYNQLVRTLNSLTTAYKECKGDYDNKLNYEPEISYTNQELYNSGKGFLKIASNTTLKDKTYYCDGKYKNCSDSESNLKTKYFLELTELDSSATSAEYKVESKKLPISNYIKKEYEIDVKHTPSTILYNNYSSGIVTDKSSGSNSKKLVNEIPVSFNRERGIYKYTIEIGNLGEFYGTNELGRLINVAKTEEHNNILVNNNNVIYSCAYLVNIEKTEPWVCDFDKDCTNNCVSNCIGPYCDGYCNGKDCVSPCIGSGCLYEKDNGLSVYERMVSLNKLFPHGTTSYNWNDSNQKAVETIEEIEKTDKGNEIYNDKPIFSITIDATDAAQIRRYNDIAEKENNGGYSNDTLDCRTLKVGSKSYAETACFSTFISNLINGKIVDDADGNEGNINVKLNSSEIKDNNEYRKIVDEIDGTGSGYFIGWSYVSESKSLGPSWK